ncbi:MAG: transporter, family, tartrate transporter [Acetobacteraceae bacterium]|jgi:ACS family tartrate transporter-like MFS transporter|nr:transporter, family, tartrate transporter [Acetobacteraceae bacterium]
MENAIEKSAMRKIYLRLLPFAFICYSLCYIDRINVSFAGLTMRGDLGLTATEFGFAAGSFYWGYFLFEVPSNIIMEKVGARLWIARIMITWGILAGLTACVTGTYSFVAVRALLGVAEAGFFPGMILYFTYWFPAVHHARIVSGILAGFVVAVAGGAPISTGLLSLDGMLGLKGWQIMYIAEAIPTIILGFATLFVMTDKPQQASFLTTEEKAWLANRLSSERTAKEAVRTFGTLEGLYNPKVLLLALNYFGIVTASLGMLFFIPQIIKSLGTFSNMTVGWLTMIPYLCGGAGLVLWGRLSDRMNERRWNLLAACCLSTAGLVIAGLTMGTWWALVGMSIAAIGFYGSKGPFWSMPPMFLTGGAAAASLAWINSIGNLGGFFGPWYVGVLKDMTGSFAGGLFGLALLSLIAALVCAFFLDIPDVTKQPTPVATAAD